MVLTKSNYGILKKGMIAPDFELADPSNQKHALKDHRGAKATLVVFMCNHCPFVIPKAPFLAELEKKYASSGLAIIGINSNDVANYPEDSPDNMKKFAKDHHFNFPYLFDENQQIAKSYGAACTPDPFLFDAKLRLAYHGRIDNAHGEPHALATTNELEQAIQQLLETGKTTIDENPSQGCSIKWRPFSP